MSEAHHVETHFTAGETVRDLVLGMADGLTVPFALAAGLTGAAAASRLIVTAGLAEIAAGSVAMGLGGYLAARSEAEHYAAEQAREHAEVVEKPHAERAEVAAVFHRYGLGDAQIAPVLQAFEKDPEAWVDFMMRFELGLEKPASGRARRSALAVGGAYVAGGLIPLFPYIVIPDVRRALSWSAAATLTALLVFGWAKGKLTSGKPWRSAGQTASIGALAAAAAFGLARLVG
ncbi:MAG: VIT1/CCC1 transporter family protein [Elusimicrobia bacterium]|nr:VIT1/CCC1 transporter family protein [Elusimicrobiota bacterium]